MKTICYFSISHSIGTDLGYPRRRRLGAGGLKVEHNEFGFAKFDVIVPASSFVASGLVDGQPRQREMAGLGDPRFRVSLNLFGAPALSAKDFANYRQDLIVGVSLQVSAPVGQYDSLLLFDFQIGNGQQATR